MSARSIALDRNELIRALYLDRHDGEMRPARVMLEELQHVTEVVRLALPDGGGGDVSIDRTLQLITRLAEFGALLDDEAWRTETANQMRLEQAQAMAAAANHVDPRLRPLPVVGISAARAMGMWSRSTRCHDLPKMPMTPEGIREELRPHAEQILFDSHGALIVIWADYTGDSYLVATPTDLDPEHGFPVIEPRNLAMIGAHGRLIDDWEWFANEWVTGDSLTTLRADGRKIGVDTGEVEDDAEGAA